MASVAVMADSTVQMTREMADEYGIKLVPLHVVIDGKSFPEDSIDLEWFYSQLPIWRETDKLPKSSSPSVGDFLTAYHDLCRDAAQSVLGISVSAAFSGTFATAVQAKKRAEQENPDVPLEILDTMTACGAQMFIAIEAARAAKAAGSFDEVARAARNTLERVSQISISPDLYYLAKGGRIHKGRSWAGSQVANAVLMEADCSTGGVNRPLGRYKTQRQAIEALLDIVNERSGGERLHVAINHAGSPLAAEEIKAEILSRFDCAEVFITPILPLVAIHNGVGTLKFSWWGEARS